MTVLRRTSGLLLFAAVAAAYFLIRAWLAPGDPAPVEITSPETTTTTTSPVDGSWDALPTEQAVGVHAFHLSTTTTAPVPPVRVTAPVAPAPPAEAPVRGGGSIWDRLAQCESGGNWSINNGNGHFGGLQFTLQSWRGVGGSGYPHENSREEQIHRGERLQAIQGWGAWPGCSRRLGLR